MAENKNHMETQGAARVNPQQLEALLKILMNAGESGLITGAPGIGKTDIVKKVHAEIGRRLFILHPVVMDPTDFKGLPFVVEGEARFLTYDFLEEICDTKEPLTVFFDDLGHAPSAVQSAIMQIWLEKSINGKRVSPLVNFLAATNRKSDRAGVNSIIEPLKSRATTILELVPDLDSFTNWAFDNDMPHELIAFVRFRPGLLTDFKPTHDVINSPCPRTLAALGRLYRILNPENGPKTENNLACPAYAGAVGEGGATEWIGFLETYKTLPDPDLVLMNPKEAPIPDEHPATMIALCTALSARVDERTAKNFFVYADRIPSGEYTATMITDAIRRFPDIRHTVEFIQWVGKNKSTLF